MVSCSSSLGNALFLVWLESGGHCNMLALSMVISTQMVETMRVLVTLHASLVAHTGVECFQKPEGKCTTLELACSHFLCVLMSKLALFLGTEEDLTHGGTSCSGHQSPSQLMTWSYFPNPLRASLEKGPLGSL